MSIFAKRDELVAVADDKIVTEPVGDTAHDEWSTGVSQATEDDLKTKIKELEKRTTNKVAHIERLYKDLGVMQHELRTLKEQRIELLKLELG